MISTRKKIDMDKPVTAEQVAAVDKLVAPEFATGNWETVESEQGEVIDSLTSASVKAKVLVDKMGAELLTEVIAEPTLNRFLDRSPKLNTPTDFEELVKILQRKRQMFITAEQKKREPKVEGDTTDDEA